MGCSSSRIEKDEALLLCKARKRFVKQMVDRRYALAAAHVGYVQALRDVGVALRRFAEAQVLIESSLSTSATETTEALAFVDKSPAHSSYPSPSPSPNAKTSDSPLNHESPTSPICISPLHANISYMKSAASVPLTSFMQRAHMLDRVKLESPFNEFAEDSTFSSSPTSPSLTFPPPPPFPEMGSSWDFFDPVASEETFSFNDENGFSRKFEDSMDSRQFREEEVVPYMGVGVKEKDGLNKGKDGFITRSVIEPHSEQKFHESSGGGDIDTDHQKRTITTTAHSFNGFPSQRLVNGEGFSQTDEAPIVVEKRLESSHILNEPGGILARSAPLERGRETEKEACTEREDASEFITHRPKDFLSSIKDIEQWFFRASESGKEVSRMLEEKKNRPTCTETKGRSPASIFLSACSLVSCTEQTALVPHEPPLVTKVIMWNRSMSSQSSSSKNPLATASKDDVDDSSSDFVEDFCMISGSHSSTLDRLYAWERKLYDEVKASEHIRKEYDKKCNQLRQQFARDLKPQVIDKTRSIVKDLFSQIKVAIHAVESISKRIEKLRDEELQPQLIELLQGLIRMWKAMLECHHKQYITISLAYHVRSSTTSTQSDSHHKQIVTHLKNEIDCFGSTFSNWIDAHMSYIEALNGWLQKCILAPQERSSRKRNIFCPRRALAPPIFVLCPDWLAGIKALPAQELSDAIKDFSSDLQASLDHHEDEKPQTQKPENWENNGESESRDEGKCEKSPEQSQQSNLDSLQASLTRVFDCLTKFSEASLKMYEDVRRGSENACQAYANGITRMGH